MEQKELQKLVEQISLKYFSLPFLHQATFNPRLKTTGGRYLTKSHHLEFNRKSYEQYGIEELVQIIKHELCHYHLHLQGKGYKHKDREFKQCLEQTGGSRYSKPLVKSNERPYRYRLICQKCGQTYLRKYKIKLNRYRCGKCKGPLMMKKID
ncbi:SprT family protein [Tepidibacillus fermentans]|uniref:Protein SprT-like n=1 Tax=Tepidibacillus fermentans TaxID=1281767 RepID=A0A4R3K9H5_9BACI|nr:SprT family protein [Tepidibacillus fermentans]TCS79578.1 SprT-like protein [Tepidibacillus fermentans]